jgi:D-alanine-D-alanine ligase
MRVAVVHNAMAAGESDASTLDVVEQAAHVRRALRKAGHAARLFSLDRDPGKTLRKLKAYRPDRVFNLVESVEGCARLHPCAAALWELMGIPHTGSGFSALEHTTDKAVAKTLLSAAGIPTPEWALCRQESDPWQRVPGPWILKPTMEDASIGIDEDSVARDPSAVGRKLRALMEKFRDQAILVERYVEGREFNLSLLAKGSAAEVLPPAEMVFADYPPGKERVVGYRAKWIPDAFEYSHTARRFDFPPEDLGLIGRMKEIALRCWALFKLRGYARVDLRVDGDSRVFVLEINANPCLSPDAGFAAAVARAGISAAEMVQRILEDTVCVPPQPRST